MPTVSPYYQQRGVANPYYVLDPATVTQAISALKREGLKNINQENYYLNQLKEYKAKQSLSLQVNINFN